MRDVHGSGYQQAPEGKSARRILACARRCEVQSQVFERLFAPLHGVFVPRCAPGMGAGPTLTEQKCSFWLFFSSLTSVLLTNGGRCRRVEHAGAWLWFTFTIKPRISPLLSPR